MKKILFITQNKFKVKEIEAVLKKYDISLEQEAIGYEEDKEASMEEVCIKASKELAKQFNRPVIVEDTGLFFEAYNNFPGALPKFVFNGIGFKGIFKLLENENRNAYFKTVIGYCEPGKEPVTFEGEMRGKILDKIVEPDTEDMPFNHIFLPDCCDKAMIEIDLEKRNSFSQRGRAAKKLGEYLSNN